MTVVLAVLSILLAVAIAGSAAMKLSHKPAIVENYARLGVAEDKLNLLAIPLLAGAVGLVVGLWWPVAGIAASIGLILYFAGAVATHLRAKDTKGLPVPAALAALSAVVLVLHLVA